MATHPLLIAVCSFSFLPVTPRSSTAQSAQPANAAEPAKAAEFIRPLRANESSLQEGSLASEAPAFGNYEDCGHRRVAMASSRGGG
jgi:hypothetical protein